MGLRTVVCALWLMWWFPAVVQAQTPTTGAITGVVRDSQSGDALVGVTVIVTRSGVSTQSAITDERGSYRINNVINKPKETPIIPKGIAVKIIKGFRTELNWATIIRSIAIKAIGRFTTIESFAFPDTSNSPPNS